FIVPTIIGTEPPCSSARKKDVERNRHSFPLTKIVAVLLFIEENVIKIAIIDFLILEFIYLLQM
ncbi:hypothetical protein DUT93_24240, partial [Bacteroides xylanisolvens]|nr:hypothetical protein [Bacteroides xylanisolvens]